MIAYIKGLLIQTTPMFVVIESRGIGYKVYIPVNLFSKLSSLNEEITLHTSFVVRELSQTLYGFVNPQDRDLFEALMGVTGVGPKMALNVIGHLSGQELYHAISQQDIPTLSKVPGIGKKTAERLMMEMRDKIASLLSLDISETPHSHPKEPHSQKISDAMSALINLGYNQITAQKAIKNTLKGVSEGIELSELITLTLKNM